MKYNEISLQKKKRPVVFAILDGWGIGSNDRSVNAIKAARTPFFDRVERDHPFTCLNASGCAVGLEVNQMSGSEAGHLNIGAGRIVKQDVRLILEDINRGSFCYNHAFLGAINKIKKRGTAMHLMGLMGNADSPHSHPDIFLSLLIALKNHGVPGERVFIHLFTDGRDSFPQSALKQLHYWKTMINQVGIGRIATLSGRFYAMDRVKNWDRLLEAYRAIVESHCEYFDSPEEAILVNYAKGNTDEYIKPAVILNQGRPVGHIRDGDGVIFFNLRSDRARQFSKLFVGSDNGKKKAAIKVKPLKDLAFVAMTNFGPDLRLETAYAATPVVHTLPVAFSSRRQLYISETEKYAHITYFINGGYSDAIAGEERMMIPSPQVRSYAEVPEMAAEKITDKIVKGLKYDLYDFITVNYPNADMVGHTGDFRATVRAVECVDRQLHKIYKQLVARDGILVLTADHGNAEVMIDPQVHQPFTFHTKNPVPFAIVSESKMEKNIKLKTGILADIAPTLLELCEIKVPDEMTGKSLLEKR